MGPGPQRDVDISTVGPFRDPDGLEKWFDRNCVKFSKRKILSPVLGTK